MGDITTIGLDLAKNVFQVHAVDVAGSVVLRKRLRRGQVLAFFAGLPPCLIGLEACATAHHWARELIALGHETRLMPPSYVKAYVKRNKHDVADAEAICEAVRRPSMRFVPLKTAEQQSALMHRWARDAGPRVAQEQPSQPTSGHHPRDRADHRHCGRCDGCRSEHIPQWQRVCRLARASAETELYRRQSAPRRN